MLPQATPVTERSETADIGQSPGRAQCCRRQGLTDRREMADE